MVRQLMLVLLVLEPVVQEQPQEQQEQPLPLVLQVTLSTGQELLEALEALLSVEVVEQEHQE